MNLLRAPINEPISDGGQIASFHYQKWFGGVTQAVTLLQGGMFEGNIPDYADNTSAIAAGLQKGQVYRTGDTLKIVH